MYIGYSSLNQINIPDIDRRNQSFSQVNILDIQKKK